MAERRENIMAETIPLKGKRPQNFLRQLISVRVNRQSRVVTETFFAVNGYEKIPIPKRRHRFNLIQARFGDIFRRIPPR